MSASSPSVHMNVQLEGSKCKAEERNNAVQHFNFNGNGFILGDELIDSRQEEPYSSC